MRLAFDAQFNPNVLAGLHGDYKRHTLKPRNQVECSLAGQSFEALRGISTDNEPSFGFSDPNRIWIALRDRFLMRRDDRKDEVQPGRPSGVGTGHDFYRPLA